MTNHVYGRFESKSELIIKLARLEYVLDQIVYISVIMYSLEIVDSDSETQFQVGKISIL